MAKKIVLLLYVVVVTLFVLSDCSFSNQNSRNMNKDTIRNYKYDSFNNPTLFVGDNILDSLDRQTSILDRHNIFKCLRINDTIVFVVDPKFIRLNEYKTIFQTREEIISYYPSYDAQFNDELPISAYLTKDKDAMCYIANPGSMYYELEHMKICSKNYMIGDLSVGLDINNFLRIDNTLFSFKDINSVVIIPTTLLFDKQNYCSNEVFEYSILISLENGIIQEIDLCDVGYNSLVDTDYSSQSSCF